MIKELNARELQDFIKGKNERQFLLVDVRQQEEYRMDHIPGATHIPLAQIQFDPYVFDDDRELIFYCRSGSRSRAAALFVAEAGYDETKMYNLNGGMLEYTGDILLDTPRIDFFPTDMDPVDIMKKSIDFEKGAFYFYTFVKEKFKDPDLYAVMEKMARAEISHAKAIYNHLKKSDDSIMDFNAFFETCKGEILEGGKSLKETQKLFDDTSEYIDFIDFSIDLEFCAYDLYKTMAESCAEKSLKDMFFTLSQAEKKHLGRMIQTLDLVVLKKNH